MDFNKFCETVAEKLGVKLIPLPTEYEFAHNYIYPSGHKPTYEEYCKRREIYKNEKFRVYFECFDITPDNQDYSCAIYNAKTHKLWGFVEYGTMCLNKPCSSFYNRDDGKQEVYYDGKSVKRACNALKKRKPTLVW